MSSFATSFGCESSTAQMRRSSPTKHSAQSSFACSVVVRVRVRVRIRVRLAHDEVLGLGLG